MSSGRLVRAAALFARLPSAALACALVACVNAVCWSLITPPFEAPDEPAHIAYVQQLAETHSLPSSHYADYSEEEEVAIRDTDAREVRWHPERHPVARPSEQRRLARDLARPLQRTGPGGAGVATSQPPLYYALQTIPYLVGRRLNLLGRIQLMRLLSALMAAFTALFVYLFLREALPRARWAWTAGGLSVALAPQLGFMSGAVNPDSMLAAVSAATFFVLARAFRRELTPKLAVAVGVVLGVGLLTKVNYAGLLPGVLIGLIVLTVRAARTSARRGLASLAMAVGIPAAPVVLYVVINLISNRPALGVVSSAIQLTGARGDLLREISYIWQSYLPRLPGMTDYFPGISTTVQMWFDRSVGFYGWNDTSFPVWVDRVALVPAIVLVLLAGRELVVSRLSLRRRVPELGVYALMAVGLLGVIGADSYLVPHSAGTYSEPRYLLPLLALLAAGLAMSARGAGRRWGPAVGALIVVLFLGHDVFSQLQVLARFYG